MWSDLPTPWQACFELAWEAYCDDCVPIGAVVTNANGEILTRGRNRVFEKVKPGEHINGSALAHAEMEALQSLDLDAIDPHICTLYTTTEPCPMCMGTFYMSGLHTLYYGARDPFAGSVNLLSKTWYMARKPIKVFGPYDLLEEVITGLYVEQDYSLHKGKLPEGDYYNRMRDILPRAVKFGERLWRSGMIQEMRSPRTRVEDVFNSLASRLGLL